MPDEIMTVRQMAEYLKIKERTVYNLVKEGKIPGTRIGRSWRFKKYIIDKVFFQSSIKDSGGAAGSM